VEPKRFKLLYVKVIIHNNFFGSTEFYHHPVSPAKTWQSCKDLAVLQRPCQSCKDPVSPAKTWQSCKDPVSPAKTLSLDPVSPAKTWQS
jgi:hypothetical protein